MADTPPTGTITLLFSDIEGSTRLLQRTGEGYAELLTGHRRLLHETFDRRGGFVLDSEGDAFFVAFASANDAATAATDAQRALAEAEWPGGHEIRVRIGLHTGEPRLVAGSYVGLDVHHAARVMAAGHGGQVLVSATTRALLDDGIRVRDLGEHRLKDLAGTERLYQLEVDGLPVEFPPLRTLEHRPTNLPAQPNEFFDRVRERADARGLLARDDVRMLTLIGTGGTGKTRLALQFAAEVIDRFPNGVFFVSLAPVRDPELVVPTIAQTLGLREQSGETLLATLIEYLRGKAMLLVLDNFEHVLSAARAVGELPSSAPDLKLLVTSRSPLRLRGERAYPVPQLPLPDLRRPAAAAEMAEAHSVQLFVARAQAAGADFDVNDENVQAVAEICVRLDGLPLAIELAAPRVRALTPPALLRRLDQRLRLLTGGARDLDERQRTLRRTIEWSYDLLPAPEKTLFARMGVFVGGCRLEAAEAVCDPDGSLGIEVFDGLDSLVENSLVRRRADADGEPRFWKLETIREFALELLESSGTLEDVCFRHAVWVASTAEELDLESRTGDISAFLARVDDEYPNIREAIGYARKARDGELLMRLATALWGFWSTHGYVAEGRKALEEAIDISGRRPARALLGLCTLRAMSGGSDRLLEDAREALRAAEELDDDFSLAQAWNLLGRIQGGLLGAIGDAEVSWGHALSYAERGGYAAEKAESLGWLLVSAVFGPLPAVDGIARCKEVHDFADDDPTITAWCCVERSVLEAMRGDFDLARDLLANGTHALAELGLTVWAANAVQEAFLIESLAGTPQAATGALRRSYAVLDDMGERGFRSTIAGMLAHALCAQGEYEEARRFSRASEEAAAPDDVFSQMMWRTSRARLLAHEGDLERAEALAREAVELGEPTDLLNAKADALCDLAEILALAGRREAAVAALEEAARLHERKGNVSGFDRTQSVVRRLVVDSSVP